MQSEKTVTIADQVIFRCGGKKVVSDWLGLDLAQVYKFTYPKEKGGTGGLIPARHQPTLLAKAREAGRSLQATDFFELDPLVVEALTQPERAAS